MATPPIGPNIQATLSVLLSNFLRYTKATSQAERDQLELQILALFDSLGAVQTQSIIEARATFEGLRAVKVADGTPDLTFGSIARSFATDEIRRLERRTPQIRLTGPARQMLRIPLAEFANRTEGFNEEQARESIDRILTSLRDSPNSVAEGDRRTKTSIAVIWAFAKNFCNIPPFCAGKQL